MIASPSSALSLSPSLFLSLYDLNSKYDLFLFSINHKKLFLEFSYSYKTKTYILKIYLHGWVLAVIKQEVTKNFLRTRTIYIYIPSFSLSLSHFYKNGTPFLLFEAEIKKRFMVTWRRWKIVQLHYSFWCRLLEFSSEACW